MLICTARYAFNSSNVCFRWRKYEIFREQVCILYCYVPGCLLRNVYIMGLLLTDIMFSFNCPHAVFLWRRRSRSHGKSWKMKSFQRARLQGAFLFIPLISLEYWEYRADSHPRQTALTIFLIDNKWGNRRSVESTIKINQSEGIAAPARRGSLKKVLQALTPSLALVLPHFFSRSFSLVPNNREPGKG